MKSSIEEISELRKRSEVLEMVIKERKNLTEKMKKMDMVEDAIVRLKEKALLADQLAEENQKMCQVLEIMKYKPHVFLAEIFFLTTFRIIVGENFKKMRVMDIKQNSRLKTVF